MCSKAEHLKDGPRHILTARHNVFRKGKWAKKITARVALNGKMAPYGEQTVVRAYTYNKYITEENPDYDIGLLVLNEDIGNIVGWAGMSSLSDEELRDQEVHVTGYPGDKGFTSIIPCRTASSV